MVLVLWSLSFLACFLFSFLLRLCSAWTPLPKLACSCAIVFEIESEDLVSMDDLSLSIGATVLDLEETGDTFHAEQGLLNALARAALIHYLWKREVGRKGCTPSPGCQVPKGLMLGQNGGSLAGHPFVSSRLVCPLITRSFSLNCLVLRNKGVVPLGCTPSGAIIAQLVPLPHEHGPSLPPPLGSPLVHLPLHARTEART